MKRTAPKSVGDVISDLLSTSDSRRRLLEIRAAECWPAIVGDALARSMSKPFVRDGVMTIRIPSAPLRGELSMHRSSLMDAINRMVAPGEDIQIVKSIRFLS